MTNENPLVSIIVITYNSAKYVLETLESAKVQTYQNIELIVSDDCSTDNTVEICCNWLEKNRERFVRTKLVTVEKNTGISPNGNRGLKAAQGEWVKFMAGDDLLLPYAIDTYIVEVGKKPEASFFFAKINTFGNSNISTHSNSFWEPRYKLFSLLETSGKQARFLKTYYNFIPAASGFIKTETLLKLDGFDEEIPFLEDYPIWLRATQNGYTLHFIYEILVNYRASSDSIQTNPKFYLSGFLFLQKYILKNPVYKFLAKHIDAMNPTTTRNSIYVFILRISSSPQKIIRKIKKTITKPIKL